ncbi:MAG: ribonuclease HI family protein [Candidatus Shapirobacteria bacterium]|nr:ribonuclease HI family protein [Candidatus Shapirobacteria bacterium]
MKNLNVFTDGGARGNPGPAGIGIIIKAGQKTIFSHSGYIGQATNNVAEYQALIKAFDWLEKNGQEVAKFNQINCYLDSLLIVAQLSGRYKIKAPHLASLVMIIKNKEEKLPVEIFYHHIPREKNSEADELVNQALDKIIE